jgi:flagellar motor switch protein FliM
MGGDILSQSEINTLLEALSASGSEMPPSSKEPEDLNLILRKIFLNKVRSLQIGDIFSNDDIEKIIKMVFKDRGE